MSADEVYSKISIYITYGILLLYYLLVVRYTVAGRGEADVKEVEGIGDDEDRTALRPDWAGPAAAAAATVTNVSREPLATDVTSAHHVVASHLIHSDKCTSPLSPHTRARYSVCCVVYAFRQSSCPARLTFAVPSLQVVRTGNIILYDPHECDLRLIRDKFSDRGRTGCRTAARSNRLDRHDNVQKSADSQPRGPWTTSLTGVRSRRHRPPPRVSVRIPGVAVFSPAAAAAATVTPRPRDRPSRRPHRHAMARSGVVAPLVQLLLCAAALRPVMVSGQDADSLASSFFSGTSHVLLIMQILVSSGQYEVTLTSPSDR